MITRALAAGLEVSMVGLGGGALGDLRMSDHDADVLIGTALDHGVTLIDTARSYGASEDRLGRALAGRRDRVVLVTKGGYGVDGIADWTPAVIREGIEGALRRLRTDRLDAFLFHSCPMNVLVRDDLLAELDRAKEAGKIRLRGYSGENEELAWAVSSGRFDVVETSVSYLDRASLAHSIPLAVSRGLGVLAKRPLGNAPWRFVSSGHDPEAPDLREALRRHRALAIDPSPLAWPELAIRFSAHAPGVTSALVGTSNASNLITAISAASLGPLEPAPGSRLDDAWDLHGTRWPGVI